MDRDPQENVVDAEDRTTHTTGNSDYGEIGAKRARKAAGRDGTSEDSGDEPETSEPPVSPPPD
jgi:hypothetical protein